MDCNDRDVAGTLAPSFDGRHASRSGSQDLSPEPGNVLVIGPAERSACEYVGELCEGLLLLEGVSRLPKLGLQLMLLHALCLDYISAAA